MNSYRVMVFTLAVGAILAACNAKMVMAPLPGGVEQSSSNASKVAHGASTLTIALPAIEPSGVPYPWTATAPPLWLSPSTASISGTVGKRRFGPIPLGKGASACATPAPGIPLQCSITVSAPRGPNVSLTMTTYASATSTKPLASGSQRVQIFPGSNDVTATIAGIAQKIVSRLMPDSLRQGQYSNHPLVAYGVDAAGQIIPGQIANGAAIDVHLSGLVDQNINQTCDDYNYCNQLYCCGVVTLFAYNGLATGTETFKTTSTIGYNSTSTRVVVRPGNTQFATLLAGTDSQTGYLNLQFAMGSSGNAAPVRSIGLLPATAQELYGEDSAGDYWAWTSHYSNTGSVLGTISVPSPLQPVAADRQGHIYATSEEACGFTEFPANTYGKLSPIRKVTCSGERVSHPVFDGAGDVFVSLPYANGAATILEYPPTGSGTLPPSRTISIPNSGYSAFQAMACDGSGNLYALLYDGAAPEKLLEFAPGATTGQQILAGVPISTFTVDDAGDIFAATQTSQSAPVAIEEFPPGSSTPSMVITGPKTQLTDGIEQLVVPQ
jgi:hypothetical protein